MVRVIFGIVRVFAGMMGAMAVLGGLLGVANAVSDHAWGVIFGAVVTAMIGFCVAYSAFVRAPWEPQSRPKDRAS